MSKTNEYTNHTGGAYGANTYGCVIGIELDETYFNIAKERIGE